LLIIYFKKIFFELNLFYFKLNSRTCKINNFKTNNTSNLINRISPKEEFKLDQTQAVLIITLITIRAWIIRNHKTIQYKINNKIISRTYSLIINRITKFKAFKSSNLNSLSRQMLHTITDFGDRSYRGIIE
jgi:hypothetical protein